VNSISLLKNQSKGPISTPLIKPVYYGMDKKVSNDDNHILTKLKGGIKTTKDIKINGVQLIEKLGERPLTGQFSILLKKQLEKSNIRQSITNYWISVDAGSAEVYHQVRLGGDWKILMENFEFLSANRGKSQVLLMYVVQQKNYKDIFNFFEMCKQFNFRGNLVHLDDWGTWNNDVVAQPDVWTIKHGIFSDHNVLDFNHPEYAQCKEIVIQAQKKYKASVSDRVLSQLGINQIK